MDPCHAAEALANSWYMKAQLGAKIFTCFLGMALIFWFSKRHGIHWLGHPNAKWIFSTHLLFSFLVAFNFCIVHSLDIIRLSMRHGDPCDYLIPVTYSFALRGPCQIFIYIQGLSMFALAIERLLAVRRPKVYEQTTKPTFAIVAIILVITFSIVFVLAMFLPGVNFDGRYPGFVSKTKENALRFYIVIAFQFIPEIATLIIFHVVRNKSKCTIDQDLSTRYQLEENRKVCHHLLPVFYTHAVILMCTSGGISLIPLYQYIFGLDDLTFAQALETTGWALLYAALMPIIVRLRQRYRKRKLTKRTNLGMRSYFIPIDDYPEVLRRRDSSSCYETRS